MNIAIAIIVAMVARAQSLNCYKCQDANLKSGVENTCTKYSVQQCAAGKDVCASRATTFYEGSKFSYMKSYQCMTTADESSELDECMGFKSEFEDALDDLKAYACAIEKCNDDLCNGRIVPGSGFTPVPNHGYEIKILNGPASGYFLTANDERNGHSRWVHTELNDQSARWEIILTQHNGQDCFNIKSKSGATAGIGKMLVVHSDKQSNGDARALVHRTPHGNGDDECWSIETVTVVGGVGYRFKKSQGRSRDTYLVSRIQRESGSYWVDVTSDMSAPILWDIDGSASSSTSSEVGRLNIASAEMKNQLGSYPPPNLIDGNLQNFAHTLGAEDGMWIRINLEQCSLVTKVTVYNRHNCCTERIIGASIFIKAGNSYVKDCGKISSSKTSYTFNCEGTGNVIEISQEKKVGPWNLAEIQVYGTSSDSLCTDKPVLIAARSGGIYDMASLQPGNQITAWGVYQDGTSKFSVNIVAVPDRNINLLHVDFRFGVLVMNCKYGNWGREKRVNYNNKRFEAGKEFKVTIKVSADEYQVYLDDEEIGRYPAQRLNLANAVQLVGGSRGFKWTKLGLPSN